MLGQIVNSTKNGKTVFDTAGQLALQKLFEIDTSDFSPLSSKDWMSGINGVITVILIVALAYLYFKIKSMATMLLVISHARPNAAQSAAEYLKLQFTLPPTTTSQPFNVKTLTELISIEQTILSFLIIFIVIIIIIVAYRHFHKFHFGPQSHINIQLGNVTDSSTLPFLKLTPTT